MFANYILRIHFRNKKTFKAIWIKFFLKMLLKNAKRLYSFLILKMQLGKLIFFLLNSKVCFDFPVFYYYFFKMVSMVANKGWPYKKLTQHLVEINSQLPCLHHSHPFLCFWYSLTDRYAYRFAGWSCIQVGIIFILSLQPQNHHSKNLATAHTTLSFYLFLTVWYLNSVYLSIWIQIV